MSKKPDISDIRNTLDLQQACATFYVLEMASHKMPGGEAGPIFERYVNELAPKIARCLEYSCSTELPYFREEQDEYGDIWSDGDDCPSCCCWGTIEMDGNEAFCKCNDCCGCDEDEDGNKPCSDSNRCDGCGWSAENEEPHGPDYVDDRHLWYQAQGLDWTGALEKYGLDWYGTVAEAFHREGCWAGGFGGPKWGTIADVLRDYRNGTLRPATFLDRAWTLQHNNASVFDKAFYIDGLMQVLVVQADNDYDKLAYKWTEPYIARLWSRTVNRAAALERYDPIYKARRCPDWAGTGD